MLFKGVVSGYEVTYCNITGIYQVLDGEAVIKESKSYDAIEQFIQSGGEKKEKKKRLNKKIIFNEYGILMNAEITAFAESRLNASQTWVWIVVNGKRKKESLRDCYAHTPDNVNKISAIIKLGKQGDEINNSIDEIKKSLVNVTKEDLTIEEGEGN